MKKMESLSYRVLIFDWDGTVKDSIGSIVGCALEALESVGFAGDAKAIRDTVGLDIQTSIERWAPAASAAQRQQIQQAYRDGWIAEWHARGELFPGVAQELQRLHAEGHWLVIATGKSRVGLERDLAHLPASVRELFVASRTADETESKPSPSMVFSLLDELGASPAESVVLGDSAFDLQMAVNAGCDGVGVRCGAATAEELERAGALVVLEDVLEFGAWLRRRR